MASNGTIHPLWTTYSETADLGAQRGQGAGGIRAVDDLVHGGGRGERNDRRAVGYRLAYVDWAGHVLDAGAHHDSVAGRAGGNRLRVHDFDYHVWAQRGDSGNLGEELGIPRTTWGVYFGVGLHRDADVGAF